MKKREKNEKTSSSPYPDLYFSGQPLSATLSSGFPEIQNRFPFL
jgi:hypothetical protein